MEWLIDGLMHSDERIRRRASDELRHLTDEDFGYDPGHSIVKARQAGLQQDRYLKRLLGKDREEQVIA